MGDKNFIAGIGCTNVDILYSGIDRLPNVPKNVTKCKAFFASARRRCSRNAYKSRQARY